MIEIQHRRGVLDQWCFLLQRAISLTCCPVDAVGMRIGARRQIDFRARYVEKTEGIAVGQRPRFFGIDNVVGYGGDSGRGGRIWTNSTERSDDSHREPLII